MGQNSHSPIIYRTILHFPTDCAQIAPKDVHRQLCSRLRTLQVKVKGPGQLDQKLDFSAGVPQNFSTKRRIAPKLQQSVSTPFWFKAKKIPGQRQTSRSNEPKTRFLDDLPHNLFIYRWIAPKLH